MGDMAACPHDADSGPKQQHRAAGLPRIASACATGRSVAPSSGALGAPARRFSRRAIRQFVHWHGIAGARVADPGRHVHFMVQGIGDQQLDQRVMQRWIGPSQDGQGRSLLKAASYLMHLGSFTTARDFLLTHSSIILQDDSRIPIDNFNNPGWAVRYFGSYPGPIDLFKQHNRCYQ